MLDKRQMLTFEVGKEIAETCITCRHPFLSAAAHYRALRDSGPDGRGSFYPDSISTPLPASPALNLPTKTDLDTNKNRLPQGVQTRFVARVTGTGYMAIGNGNRFDNTGHYEHKQPVRDVNASLEFTFVFGQ